MTYEQQKAHFEKTGRLRDQLERAEKIYHDYEGEDVDTIRRLSYQVEFARDAFYNHINSRLPQWANELKE
jgi:hypothetical protein